MIGNLASGFSRSILQLIIWRGTSLRQSRLETDLTQLFLSYRWCRRWWNHYSCTGLFSYSLASHLLTPSYRSSCLMWSVYENGALHGYSKLQDTFSQPCPRGKYQGIIGAVVAFGYAVGPLMGGFMAQRVSWRVCSLISPHTHPSSLPPCSGVSGSQSPYQPLQPPWSSSSSPSSPYAAISRAGSSS